MAPKEAVEPEDDDDDNLIDVAKSAEWLRDEILSLIRKEQSKPWKDMKENDQEWLAARVEQVAKSVVVKIANLVMSDEVHSIAATMGALSTDKEGAASTKITFASGLEDNDKLQIWKHINRPVMMLLVDPEAYIKIEKKAVIMKDQPGLPLEGDRTAEDWNTVGEAVTAAAPEEMPASTTAQATRDRIDAEMTSEAAEDPDAGVVEEDEDNAVREPESDLVEDEEMDPEELARIVNLPNPVKAAPPAPKAAGAPRNKKTH